MRIISGKYKRRRFDVPTNIKARPTTDFARENIFNVLSNITDFEDKRALDLFSGTGAVSFELASRGCSPVVSVENYPVQFRFILKVAKELNATEIIPIRGDVFRYLSSCKDKFDIVFADPPYNLPEFATVPEAIFSSGVIATDGIFILEHSKEHDFSKHPTFIDHREYGSVNFTIFKVQQ
ncbi:MAG: RsmD family RNA methyltransferase [Bacteroidales bacterium]